MSLLIFVSSITPSLMLSKYKAHILAYQKTSLSNPSFSGKCSRIGMINVCRTQRSNSHCIPNFVVRNSMDRSYQSFTDVSLDWGDQDQEDPKDVESPWDGAIVYRRNASISHVEYCTTLERLGFEELSTDISKSRASIMGVRVTKAVKDYPFGTPVQISVDVTRKKQKLRLDGIIKTVITLGCNRCGEPTGKSVYSNFSLLLNEEPIEEPEIINMGVIYGDDKFKYSMASDEEEEDEDDALIDWDDRLYFPPEAKEIDISKHIRDLVHVEITIDAICDSGCKGLCLKCGTNLNISNCNCSQEKTKEKTYGPLGKQMQPKGFD